MTPREDLVPFIAAAAADLYIAYRLGGWVGVAVIGVTLWMFYVGFVVTAWVVSWVSSRPSRRTP